MWQIGSYDMPSDGQPANSSLYTHLELTLEDEDAVARGDLDLPQIVRQRRNLIAPIVVAIEEQVRAFLVTDLPERLLELASAVGSSPLDEAACGSRWAASRRRSASRLR